jgi:polysaccharide export outer membrane protein
VSVRGDRSNFQPFIRTVRVGLVFAAAALIITLMGCASSKPFEVETAILPYTDEQLAARESAQSAEYQLRTGDRISVSFKYESDLNQNELLILPDGNLSMAGLSTTVRASGLTLGELDSSLTQEFSSDYRDPDLSVVITEITDPEIYVLGEVERPGLYKLPSKGLGVIQAVTAAGGFKDHANSAQTVVMRATEEGFMIRTYDLGHLEHRGIQDMMYFDLQEYDIVYVPRSTLGDFAYLTEAIFGSAVLVSQFFWDIAAISRLNNSGTVVR